VAGGKAGLPQAPKAHTRQSELKNGKSAKPGRSHQSPIRCPECTSQRVWRDGIRRTSHGDIQRWLCRDCGFRFSESTQSQVKVNVPGQVHKTLHSRTNVGDLGIRAFDSALEQELNGLSLSVGEDVSSHGVSSTITKIAKPLKTFPCYNSKCRVSASEREAKNLVKVESRIEKRAAGATEKPDLATMKGLLVQYMAWLEKEGYAEDSRYVSCIRMLINAGANLLDPENVKVVIARRKWKDGVKMQATYAYDAMTKMLGITWTKPRYTQQETLPFIPSERELDQLIAGCRSRRMAAFLQTLKETFADPGEALKLRWIDIRGNVITINQTVKGHSPRQLKVSNKLIAMLNVMPKASERIFPTSYGTMAQCFMQVRKRVARNLQNPRINKISFVTFRHWGATMIYHHTRDILLVKKLLGHKRIKNTLKYTQLIQFTDDEFDVATATTVEEAKKIVAAGFDYITEMNGIKIFRKPKRYVS